MKVGHSPTAFLIDLLACSDAATQSGPQWGYESTDLDLTLLTWHAQQQIAAHCNDEVDVVVIVVAGAGEVLVNTETYALIVGQALLIPKGTTRSIRCTSERFSYLSVHRRRRGLWPTVAGERHA